MSYFPSVRRGSPYPEEKERYLNTTVNGIQIFYPEKMRAADESKGIIISLSKVLFFKILEAEGVKIEVQTK